MLGAKAVDLVYREQWRSTLQWVPDSHYIQPTYNGAYLGRSARSVSADEKRLPRSEKQRWNISVFQPAGKQDRCILYFSLDACVMALRLL